MKILLKPCNNCKGISLILESLESIYDNSTTYIHWQVKCATCGLQPGRALTREDAIMAWNKINDEIDQTKETGGIR